MPVRLRPSTALPLRELSSLRRSNGPEGAEKLLNARERSRVRSLLEHPKLQGELKKLLSGKSPTHQAVLLRAASARSEQLLRGKALPELRAFSRRLNSLSAEQVLQKATVLDLDSTKNTSRRDPLALWSNQGLVRDRKGDPLAADNDGLFQRFTAACGTTVIQAMIAEADPVAAFAIHDAGLTSESTFDSTASFQERLLEAHGGVALGRREAQLRARLQNGLGRLERYGKATSAECEALRRHVLSAGELTAPAQRALESLRSAYEGFPSNKELSLLRRKPLAKGDMGIGALEMQRSLEQYLTPLTGARYVPTQPIEGFSRGRASRHLDAVERSLRAGYDVPFGIAEPAHWMLLTAVRGSKPERSFLVSDPDGGRTAWVKEADFLSGAFASRQFHLNKPTERPYVDSFLLPQV